MSKPFAEPCRLEPRRHPAVEGLLTLVHLCAAAIVWWQPLPVWLALVLTLLLVASLGYQFRAARKPFTLGCDRYGRWSILAGSGDAQPIQVRGATLASRLGLFLVYRRDGHWRDESRYFPVFTLPKQDYRRVRQRLTVTVGRDGLAPPRK